MDKEKEIWKDIPGYEDMYQASNLGRIKSLKRTVIRGGDPYKVQERVLKPHKDNRGYYKTSLYTNGKKKGFEVHKLIAMTFLKHTPQGQKEVIDHIDGNRLNNSVSNLRLVTTRENINYGFKNKKTTSKYAGVYWVKNRNSWRARIYAEGKRKSLGSFKEEYDAHLAYQKALEEYKLNNK